MKRSHLKYVQLALVAFILFAFYGTVRAQGVPAGTGIDLSLSSDNPTPGQSITITAKSYSIDLNSSKVTWTVNGKTVQSGVGATTLNVTAPNAGKRTNITVSATALDGTNFSQSLSIGSGSVDLILEPDGYVPPFFKGKLPVSYQNSVKIIAIPHLTNQSGKEYDPTTLVYQWTRNDQVDEAQSGYGKSSAVFAGSSIPRPYDITVTVSSRDGSTQAQSLITVSAGSPNLLFYVDDPLYGVLYNRAVGDIIRIGSQKESGVVGVPYGFNNATTKNGLTFSWIINGSERTDLAGLKSAILRAPDGQAGSSDIELDVRNPSAILQSAQASFSALFSAGTAATTSSLVQF